MCLLHGWCFLRSCGLGYCYGFSGKRERLVLDLASPGCSIATLAPQRRWVRVTRQPILVVLPAIAAALVRSGRAIT